MSPIDLIYEGHVIFEIRDVADGSLTREFILNTKTPDYFLIHPDGQSIFTGIDPWSGRGGDGGGSPSGISIGFIGFSTDNLKQWDITTGEFIREYPEEPDTIWITRSGKHLISAPENFEHYYDEFLIWCFDSHEQLITWGCENRYIAPFTTEQREQFGIEAFTSVFAGE